MAHVTRVHVEGLLGRTEPLSLDLNRDINIIFGNNGCGKTSLLKIINAAMNMSSEEMVGIPVKRVEVDIHSVDRDDVFTHTWERSKESPGIKQVESERMRLIASLSPEDPNFRDYMRLLGDTRKSAWRVRSKSRRKGNAVVNRWAHRYLPTTRLHTGDSSQSQSRDARVQEDKLNRSFAQSINSKWLVFYNQVLSQVREIQENGLVNSVLQSISLKLRPEEGPMLDPHEAFRKVKGFLSRQETVGAEGFMTEEAFCSRYQSEAGMRKVVENINDVEQRIAESMANVNQFVQVVESLFSNEKKLTNEESGLSVCLRDGTRISPGLLSSGEKHLLLILFEALTVDVNSIIIDEPELSMHIDWQRKLIPTMTTLNPDCQIIVASHSPEIMAEASDNMIFKI